MNLIFIENKKISFRYFLINKTIKEKSKNLNFE